MAVQEERVVYESKSGHSLVGILSAPAPKAAVTIDRRVVVFVHGGMANKNSFYHKTLARLVVEELHMHAFRFDFTGNGESEPIIGTSGEQYRNMMNGFWHDVDDLELTLDMLKSKMELVPFAVVGHSRGIYHCPNWNFFKPKRIQRIGSQIAHVCAAQGRLHSALLIGVNMRFRLVHWRRVWRSKVEREGRWRLEWKNRGQPVAHTVSEQDVDIYASVDLEMVSAIKTPVQNVYGMIRTDHSQAAYDTGQEMLADGVVPLSDVVEPANRIRNHELRLLQGVGHYFREEGSAEKLWAAVKAFLLRYMTKTRL